MSEQRSLNLTSLNIVKNEYLATVQQATNQLEQFISARNNTEVLQSSIEQFEQIVGVLKIVQLSGADILASAMVEGLKTIPADADETYDALLSAISASAFMLMRYFEYAQQYEKSLPALLIPFINDIREANKQALLPESKFLQANLQVSHPASGLSSTFNPDEAKRLRHMYQVGLLALLQGQNAGYALGLMQRALERLESITLQYPFAKLPWIASSALKAIKEKALALPKHRKLLFSALDRQLKNVLKDGQSVLQQQPDEQLLRGFLYLCAVSGTENEQIKQVCRHCAVMPLGYTDAELATELGNLSGPELSTIQTLAAVIQEELRISKNALEMVSQGGGDITSTYAEMIESLTRIAETLNMIGLNTPANALREQVSVLADWQANNYAASNEEMVKLADTVLYIESSVQAMQQINLSQAKLAEANAMARDQIIAQSQLAEAEKVLLEEAQANIGLIKRAMASFTESGFDAIHIANLGKSLNSLRGALIMLNMPDAANITGACMQFVDNHLLRGEAHGAIEQLMETFADAIISLEYFLEAYTAVAKQDQNILEIAQESVKALGYPVV